MLAAGVVIGALALYGAIEATHHVKHAVNKTACKLHLKKCHKHSAR